MQEKFHREASDRIGVNNSRVPIEGKNQSNQVVWNGFLVNDVIVLSGE
jgi:hypothetical protein